MQMRRFWTITLSITVLTTIVFVIDLRMKDEEQRKLIKEQIRFKAIKEMNDVIHSDAPDSLILSFDSFKGGERHRRIKYLPIIEDKAFNMIVSNIKKGVIFNLWGSNNTGFIYRYKNEALFIKDFRVYAYLYYKGDVKKSEGYRWMRQVKVESFVNLGNGWYRVIYIQNGGRHFNFNLDIGG